MTWCLLSCREPTVRLFDCRAIEAYPGSATADAAEQAPEWQAGFLLCNQYNNKDVKLQEHTHFQIGDASEGEGEC